MRQLFEQNEEPWSSSTMTASTGQACPHRNGECYTIPFWIFKKKIFVCTDCGRAIHGRGLQDMVTLREIDTPKKKRQVYGSRPMEYPYTCRTDGKSICIDCRHKPLFGPLCIMKGDGGMVGQACCDKYSPMSKVRACSMV